MPEIRVDKLVFDYPGIRALDDVSFTLPNGSVTALVGPNGSGKTTLLRCLAGLEQPLSGEITIDTIKVLDDPRAVYAKTGYLYDSFGVYDGLTVHQCLRHSAAMRGAATLAEERLWVDRVVERLGLGDRLHQPAKALSRGWTQRLGIAQAIIHQPEILIMDEPASGLDPDARAFLSDLVKKLNREGMTIIISSHILTELQAYSSHMLTLAKGKVLGFEALAGAYSAQSVQIRISLARPQDDFKAQLGAVTGVMISECTSDSALIEVVGGPAQQSAVLAELVAKKLPVMSFSPVMRDMQTIYRHQLTTEGQQQ